MLFCGCSNLEYVNLPSSIINIGNYSFLMCHKLSDINLPYNLDSIGEGAFQECYKLETLKILENVTNIGELCFWESGLKRLIMKPATPPKLYNDRVFSGVDGTKLESILVPEESFYVYRTADGWSAYSNIMVPVRF